MNDKKVHLYTIVYQLPVTSQQLFGVQDPYAVAKQELTEALIEDKLEQGLFTEADNVIARIKAGL
jgi:hypothetical protein